MSKFNRKTNFSRFTAIQEGIHGYWLLPKTEDITLFGKSRMSPD
jgi:hypothetical protein